MTLTVRIRDAALAEAREAADWYEAQREGMGAELLTAVDACISFAAERPLSAPAWRGDIRRRRVARFPYVVFFRGRAHEPATRLLRGPLTTNTNPWLIRRGS